MPTGPAFYDHPMPPWRRKPEFADTKRYCPVCRESLAYTASPPCPGCGRDYDPNDLATTSPHPKVYCANCTYDMVGIDAGPCPECGTLYDPFNRKTFETSPVAHRKQRDTAFKVLAAVALLLGVGFLTQRTIIPRPAIRTDGSWTWTVWMWLDEPYGVLHTQAAPFGRRVHFWEGTVLSIEADMPSGPPLQRLRTRTTPQRLTMRVLEDAAEVDPDAPLVIVGETILPETPAPIAETSPPPAPSVPASPPTPGLPTLAYRVDRNGDEWTLTVARDGVSWQQLLLGFNSTRTVNEVLGVRITSWDAELNTEPFTVAGDDLAIFQKLIDVYGITIEPGYTYADPDNVWVQDDDLQLVRVPIEKAREMGFDPRLVSGASISRLRPRLR